MRVASLRCLVVIAIGTMVTTTIWAKTVTFGRRLRTVATVATSRGTVYCITTIQMSSGTAPVRGTASRFVVFGIRWEDSSMMGILTPTTEVVGYRWGNTKTQIETHNFNRGDAKAQNKKTGTTLCETP